MTLDSIRQIDSLASNDINYEIPRSKEETRFVKDYEEEEKYNLSVLTDPGKVPTEGVFFYKPVNGVVTSHYETDVHHYGVDLAAAPKESVLATLDGTVTVSYTHLTRTCFSEKSYVFWEIHVRVFPEMILM